MTPFMKRLCLLHTIGIFLVGAGFAFPNPTEAIEEAEAVSPADPMPHDESLLHDAAHPEVVHHDHADHGHGHGHDDHPLPSMASTVPFVTILLCIALLPLIPQTEHWWHKNQNKLLVSTILAAISIGYYAIRDFGYHGADTGMETVLSVLNHAILAEYIPFIVLLFSLYTIAGGIQLKGDLRATPATNTAFLAVGAGIASFVGTTGAAMLLIRPLLQTNAERQNVKHTVIFFIFLVSNLGGLLTPLGDPPLFLGYLKGVSFLWTMNLWKEWLFCCVILLIVYYMWDTKLYKAEKPLDRLLDDTHREPLQLNGKLNFVWLAGVVFAVALLVPGKPFLGKFFVVPPFMREVVQLMFVGIAWVTGSKLIRKENKFDFFAIAEVACLFIGIFICMQAPVEILNIKGPSLGMDTPTELFWATGTLSAFLDNAPTYVVFFETARSLPATAEGMIQLAGGGSIREDLLIAISLGAVFMGAMTYIGNGPNFMVKAIAEQSDVKMPSFFGYMGYSCVFLLPVFALTIVIFFYVLP